MELDDILSGSSPAEVLRAFLADAPGRTNGDAAIWFFKRFPEVVDEARHVIWNLRTPARGSGIDDESLDAQLREYLAQAGYFKEP